MQVENFDRPLPWLFVYGTLQPGRLRWPVLEPFAVSHAPAEVPGAIYDSGLGWPVAQLVGPTDGLAPGTLVELDGARLVEALEILDEIEDTATEDFVRVVVTTIDGIEASAYHANQLPPGSVRIERWVSEDER